MSSIQVGDIVARKSYGFDLLFKVIHISNNGKENMYTLAGISYRIQADAPESDLIVQSDQRINEHRNLMRNVIEKKTNNVYMAALSGSLKKTYSRGTPKEEPRGYFKPGKILHIDGDNDYLQSCIDQYTKFGMEVVGKYIPEKDQPSGLLRMLQEYRPDILVLTGHDSFSKGSANYDLVDNYKNSKYYISAVKEARKYQSDMDSLIIFAGACQSMYSQILQAGANYASSPKRVLIHALDPVFICQKIAFTSIDKTLPAQDVVNNSITGSDGIGGIQTRGKYRSGFPSEA